MTIKKYTKEEIDKMDMPPPGASSEVRTVTGGLGAPTKRKDQMVLLQKSAKK